MGKPIQVLISWSKVPPLQMASLAHNVSAKLTLNVSAFPSPPITPANLDSAANVLELAYANRMNGNAAKIAFETADKGVDEALHILADYVNNIANGVAATIELAGFTATSNDRHAAVVPATPAAPKVTGNAAALHLQVDRVPGAESYCWVIFTGEVSSVTVAETHITLSGAGIVIPDGLTRETLHNSFPAGTRVTVQVLAQNTAGKSGFSAAVSFTVGS
jgi:hypothetical protein